MDNERFHGSARVRWCRDFQRTKCRQQLIRAARRVKENRCEVDVRLTNSRLKRVVHDARLSDARAARDAEDCNAIVLIDRASQMVHLIKVLCAEEDRHERELYVRRRNPYRPSLILYGD